MTATLVQEATSRFADVWARAATIDGWLSEREAELLYQAAMSTPADGTIVEIGSYCGRSMEVLAASGRNVVCIDPLEPGTKTGDFEINASHAATLAANISLHSNVEWQRKTTAECEPPKSINLLYIDGDHEAPAPLEDFRRFAPRLAPGAVVLFHDCESPGPKAAIERLEKSYWLQPMYAAGGMYAGRLSMVKCLIGQPYYHHIEELSRTARENAKAGYRNVLADWYAAKSSILTHSHNKCVARCLNYGPYDMLAILHADHEPPAGWLGKMIGIMRERDFDVLNAVAPINTEQGHTSTAIAYSDDVWAKKRRITTTELTKLPKTFDIEDVRRELAPEALYLLPNTGCLLLRADTWLKDMPPFHILDMFDTDNCGERQSRFVSEDWNFGFWCGRNGLSVGATVLTDHAHIGPHRYCADKPWGEATDTSWEKEHCTKTPG